MRTLTAANFLPNLCFLRFLFACSLRMNYKDDETEAAIKTAWGDRDAGKLIL